MKRIFFVVLVSCVYGICNAQTTYTFTCPTTSTTWTVPAGVTSISVDARGGSGGWAGPTSSLTGTQYPGLGGRVQATLAVTPGSTLFINVGGVGANGSAAGTTGGFNGGGSSYNHVGVYSGGGGGGASDVRVGGAALANRVIVAAGGGGCGWDGSTCGGTQAGGNGGGLIGASVSTCTGVLSGWGYYIIINSTGGTQLAGGTGGWIDDGTGTYSAGNNGTLGVGGDAPAWDPGIGGGGGGGYYGGGGGCWMGGGGGSSYTDPVLASGVTLTSGYNTGCGEVIITVLCTPPSSITGTAIVCSGSTTTLYDATTGGTWSSSASGTASIGATTGILTGGTAGTATISYTVSGCSTTTTVTVTPMPTVIGGTLSMCQGATTTLTDAVTGGTWSSVTTSVATVNPASGVVTGIAPGTSLISYTIGTSCVMTATVTVNPNPASILGSTPICPGASITLTDVTTGGTWSGGTGVASIGSGTGVVTGLATTGGTVTMTYTLASTTCRTTAVVTVYPNPAAITGPTSVCLGSNITLNDASTGGLWTSSASSIAPVVPTTGVVNGAGVGTAVITYTNTTTNCYVTHNDTVYAVPTSIVGPNTVCLGSIVTLSNATSGGSWTSSFTGIATVGATTGYVTGSALGVDTIIYTIGSGCRATMLITVSPLPAIITGATHLCEDSVITLTDITTGGSWSSGNTAIATIGATSGIVTGVTTTTSVVTITYTVGSTGCYRTTPLTVNALPDPIAGASGACIGACVTLLEATTGGTWSSNTTSIATVGATSGLLCGITAGTAMITYTVTATGCQTILPAVIGNFPSAITGSTMMCVGSHSTLSDATTGGYWTSSNTAIAIVDSFSGIVTGVSYGTATISYGTGCNSTILVTVNPIPSPITGANYVCAAGGTTTLYETVTGGTWTSSNTSVATVNSSGVVSSVTVGNVIIDYSLSAGCQVTDTVTIRPLPAPMNCPDSICTGATITVTDASTGGYFTSGFTGVATINSITGVLNALSSGTSIISYTAAGTGCTVTKILYVKPPKPVSVSIIATPGDTVCLGDTVTYSASATNGGSSPTYQWYVNSSAFSGATNSTFLYSPANGSSIKCLINSNIECASANPSMSLPITMDVVDTIHPIVRMFSSLGDTICTGAFNTYHITDTLGGNSPYFQWSVNWITVASGTTSYTYNPYNGDIVVCKMVSSSRCSRPDTAMAMDTVVVKDYHQPMVSLISSGGIATCQGEPVTITANPTWSGWGPTYTWMVNGVIVPATGNQYSYTPNNGDSVKCVMLSNYYCDTPIYSNVGVSTLELNVDPVINVDISGHPGLLVTQGAYDTLFASVTNAGVSPHYQWKVNGMPLIGANSPWLVRNDFVNNDSVSCEVTTGSGTACEGVIGFHWIRLVVGHTEVNELYGQPSQFSIIPNPNKGDFVVEGSNITESTELTIEVSNAIGQVVEKETCAVVNGKLAKQFILNENTANGVYFLQIYGENVKKIVRFTINK